MFVTIIMVLVFVVYK